MADIAASTRIRDPLSAVHADLVQGGTSLTSEESLKLLRGSVDVLSGQPRRLRAGLTALLSDADRLTVAVAQSSIHPNGFAKIVVCSGGGYSVRLHVWKKRSGLWVADTQPHGHRWVFTSWIVVGTLREVVFTRYARDSATGIPYDRYAYSRKGSHPELVFQGPAILYEQEPIDRIAGEVYGRAQDVLHTATPVGDDLVASLVLQGPHHPAPTPVYVPTGQEPHRDEEDLGHDRLRSLAAEVAAAIP